jgi:hypothetical protein
MEITQGMFIVNGHKKDKGDFGQFVNKDVNFEN